MTGVSKCYRAGRPSIKQMWRIIVLNMFINEPLSMNMFINEPSLMNMFINERFIHEHVHKWTVHLWTCSLVNRFWWTCSLMNRFRWTCSLYVIRHASYIMNRFHWTGFIMNTYDFTPFLVLLLTKHNQTLRALSPPQHIICFCKQRTTRASFLCFC